jgi:hypothetical protein
MWRRVAVVRTEISEELIASARVTGGEPFFRNVGSYTNHTASHPKEGILHSHRRKNLKSYIALIGWAL